ncbi:MAG: septum formation initiator family protein [Patescibacteria group bacterium]|nr:septum formation initiator family protein [Patescibacteria group bacterium]
MRHKHLKKNPSGRSSSWRGRIWNSSILALLLFFLLIFSFIKVSRELMLRHQINQEIRSLENKLSDLEDKNRKIEQLIVYLNTEDYIEREARLKLNLGRAGEKQVFLTGGQEISRLSEPEIQRSNFTKWFDYFFN